LEKSLKSLGLDYVDLFLIVSLVECKGHGGDLLTSCCSTGLFC
jgi:diketogulonate reductase-like aldo/keto reductase